MVVAEVTHADGGAKRFERASFTGSAREYFGIWIVNVLLSILTLGIYSAWAKVRRKRYFYGNTILLDHSFEYHARPMKILIGRLIVLIFVALTQMVANVFPPAAPFMSLAILLLLPFLLVRGLRFNARVTSYRNVRFDFVGTVGGAFACFCFGGLMVVCSLGLLLPYSTRWYHRYLFDNLRYGDRKLSTRPPVADLYGAYGIVVVFLIVSFMLVFAALRGGYLYLRVPGTPGVDPGGVLLIAFAVPLVLYLIGAQYYRAAVRNIVWSSASVDGRHDLRSDLDRIRFTWIFISNIVVTLCTLGLLRPWAAVRQARYVIEHTAIRLDGDPGVVFDRIGASGSAISAEYLDVDGFDFGF